MQDCWTKWHDCSFLTLLIWLLESEIYFGVIYLETSLVLSPFPNSLRISQLVSQVSQGEMGKRAVGCSQLVIRVEFGLIKATILLFYCSVDLWPVMAPIRLNFLTPCGSKSGLNSWNFQQQLTASCWMWKLTIRVGLVMLIAAVCGFNFQPTCKLSKTQIRCVSRHFKGSNSWLWQQVY